MAASRRMVRPLPHSRPSSSTESSQSEPLCILNSPRSRMKSKAWLVCLLVLLVVAMTAPLIGSTHIELGRAFAHVSPDFEIFFYARVPRVLLSLLAGAALSITGVLFQCMLRDPLAEPY